MTRDEKLNAYRDTIQSIFARNMLAIDRSAEWTQEERTGTAICALSSALGAASGMWQMVNPHLHGAPVHVCIDDLMGVLREVLAQRRPQPLHVVAGKDTP